MRFSLAWGKWALVALLGCGLAACSGEEPAAVREVRDRPASSILERIQERDRLLVGVSADLPPFSSTDLDGNYVGLEIDIARAIARELLGSDNQVEFVPIYDASRRVELLNRGQIDLAISALKPTPDLQAAIATSRPYYASGVGLLIRKDSGLDGWQDFQGRTVCAIQGAEYNSTLVKMRLELAVYRSPDEALLALDEERCIGFAYDDAGIASLLQDPERAREWHQGVPRILASPWVIGLPRDAIGFELAINDILDKMAARGFIARAESRWQIPNTDYARQLQVNAQNRLETRQASRRDRLPSNVDRFSLVSETLLIDGSTSVYPLLARFANLFERTYPDVRIAIGDSGTEMGLERLCRGDIDIATASSPIAATHIERCEANEIEYIEIPLAFDGIVLATHLDNHWIDCLSPNELAGIWRESDRQDPPTWNQIRRDFPERPLLLLGDMANSGTYRYFVRALLGDSEPRRNYAAERDDQLLVQRIASDPDSLGFIDFAAYQRHRQTLKAIAIEDRRGRCIFPSSASIADGSYTPLSRPLLFYISRTAWQQNPNAREFVRTLLTDASNAEIAAAGYVPLPRDLRARARDRLQRARTGTIFAGDRSTGLRDRF